MLLLFGDLIDILKFHRRSRIHERPSKLMNSVVGFTEKSLTMLSLHMSSFVNFHCRSRIHDSSSSFINSVGGLNGR